MVRALSTNTLFLVLHVLFSSYAFTEEQPQSLPQGEKTALTMCIDHYPPLQIILSDGTVSGEYVVLTRELLRRAGISVQFTQNVPFKRCLARLKNGTVDLVAGLLSSPERLEVAHMFLFDDNRVVVFYVHKNSFNIEKFEDLEGLNIGAVRGVNHFDEFDNPAKQVFFTTHVDNLHTGFKMLAKGRLDVFIASLHTSTTFLEGAPELKELIKKSSYEVHSNTEVFIALSKKSRFAYLSPKLEKISKKMFISGEFRNLINGFQKEYPEYY